MDDDGDLSSVRTPRRIARFALPSVVMMVVISSYTVVDGAFISHFLGTDALAALNLLSPVFAIVAAVAFMLATGGCAYVATLMGKGRIEDAGRSAFQIFASTIAIAVLIAVIAFALAEPIVGFLGADDDLRSLALGYWYVLVPFIPCIMLQYVGIQFLVAAGRPGTALSASIVNGFTNISLDWILMGPCDMGMFGAALASGAGSTVTMIIAMTVLCSKNSAIPLHRAMPTCEVLVPSCTNGVSEMASNLSAAITVFLYNMVMMRDLGPDGVSAIAIVSFVEFMAVAAISGYAMGVAPVMSFFNGARDIDGMRVLFRFSSIAIAVFSVIVFVFMELFAGTVSDIFAGGSDAVWNIATDGARIYSVAFLFMGLNIYASSLFTSLSNGLVSALISSIRGILLLAPMIVVLPYLFGIDAVWCAVALTEIATLAVSTAFVIKLGPDYGFLAARQRGMHKSDRCYSSPVGHRIMLI